MVNEKCPKCGDSGWKPNIDPTTGQRIWLPLMNDGLPCECGALARKYAAEKAAPGVPVFTAPPACKGDPGECEHNGACMYACGVGLDGGTKA